MAKDLKSVMEGSTPSDMMSEEHDEPSYDAFTTKLQELLGLDESKAQELRDTICGLAQEELSNKDETGPSESSPSEMPKKKPGLAVIIGGSK